MAPNDTTENSSNDVDNNTRDRPHHCIEVWGIPDAVYEIDDAKTRRDAIFNQIAKHSDKGPFPPNSLTNVAPISILEELAVVVSLGILIGGPLAWVFTMLTLLILGTWQQLFVATIVSLVLGFHPMPSHDYGRKNVITSWWTKSLYKYFSYRFVWHGNSHEKVWDRQPWVGAGPPHGVLPFANVLSIPGINSVACIDFVGAPASVVMHTPFLRYMTLFPSVQVGGPSIAATIAKGTSVGIVPDGIAGIFRQSPHKEVVALKTRKGLARLALRHGINILPAYSFGNTQTFSAWWDPWGYCEKISRKSQASIFLYWGRFGLPIPRRCQITMVYGDPIVVDKVDNPTEQQISELHDKILEGIQECFEEHKASLGWGDKDLEFD